MQYRAGHQAYLTTELVADFWKPEYFKYKFKLLLPLKEMDSLATLGSKSPKRSDWWSWRAAASFILDMFSRVTHSPYLVHITQLIDMPGPCKHLNVYFCWKILASKIFIMRTAF